MFLSKRFISKHLPKLCDFETTDLNCIHHYFGFGNYHKFGYNGEKQQADDKNRRQKKIVTFSEISSLFIRPKKSKI